MLILQLCFILVAITALSVRGLIHNLHLRDDDRSIFKIETFGFNGGGVINITIHNFNVVIPESESKEYLSHNKSAKIGFLMRKARTETTAQQDLESFIERQACILDEEFRHSDDIFLDLSQRSSWKYSNKGSVVRPSAAGLYSLIFARCHVLGHATVSFSLHADFHNAGPNYLSAGDVPLPALYMVFFVLFGVALGVWCYVLSRPQVTHGLVQSIHHFMTALLAVKALSLLFESIRYHYIALVGASQIWSFVYYVFAALKGIMLFIAILLIGSGWSLMKGYLNDKEKKIVLAVLVLQVINNIAMVVIEETAPGTKAWLMWRDTLHIVDILCCCAILFPIVWSIRHLRQAAEVDGKVQQNIAKLQLFRQFYIMVITYIYFTRIVVDLIEASIPYYMLWLGPFCAELAALLFFTTTGYQFRPSVGNPYLALSTEDDGPGAGDDDSETTGGTGGGSGLALSQYVNSESESQFAADTEYGLKNHYSTNSVGFPPKGKASQGAAGRKLSSGSPRHTSHHPHGGGSACSDPAEDIEMAASVVSASVSAAAGAAVTSSGNAAKMSRVARDANDPMAALELSSTGSS